MDWNKYRYVSKWNNPNGIYGTVLGCGCYNSINPTFTGTTFTGTTFDDVMDGVVADVTDSYKELSSERVEE